MQSKPKKQEPPVEPAPEPAIDPAREKDLKEQEYTDQGTAYEEDEFQQYPEVKEEKGVGSGKEENKKPL
jgi:hypothetical protein